MVYVHPGLSLLVFYTARFIFTYNQKLKRKKENTGIKQAGSIMVLINLEKKTQYTQKMARSLQLILCYQGMEALRKSWLCYW